MSTLELVQSIGIVVSIILALIQMRMYVRSLSASAHVDSLRHLHEINRIILEYPKEFAKLKENYKPKSLPETDSRAHLMDMIFVMFEEVYFQHSKYKLLDKELLPPWIRTIKTILNLPYAAGYWQAIKDEYPESFKKFIDELRYS